MGNLKDAVVSLIGKNKASPKGGELEPGDEPSSQTQEQKFVNNPTLHLAGIRPEHVKEYRREGYTEQYNDRKEKEKERAELKAEEDKQLEVGLDNRKIEGGKVTQDELALQMGDVPKRGVIRKVVHPQEDTEQK